MSKISYVVQFAIADGKLDEFKNQSTGFIASVEANEPDTLGYQWHIGEDGKQALLHESFASSEALLTHLGNVGPTLPDLLAIAPITRLEVFGTASDAAREALAGLGATHYPHHAGFSR